MSTPASPKKVDPVELFNAVSAIIAEQFNIPNAARGYDELEKELALSAEPVFRLDRGFPFGFCTQLKSRYHYRNGGRGRRPYNMDMMTKTLLAEDEDDDATVSKKSEKRQPFRIWHLWKHPLQNTWTLWYLEIDRSQPWEEMQNEVVSFDTVEDFWSLYNNIKLPSELRVGTDYSLFKYGIRPMWEDAINAEGGRWVVTLNKYVHVDLDSMWLHMLLCLIGECFRNTDEVCGTVVSLRPKNNKISIWTVTDINGKGASEVGLKLQHFFNLGPHNLQFIRHKDAIAKQAIHNQYVGAYTMGRIPNSTIKTVSVGTNTGPYM